jgi:predicted SAM-dependent methyltransferase
MNTLAINEINTINKIRKNYRLKNLLLNNIFFLENSIGSKIFKKKIAQAHLGKYLNLGCSGNEFKEWINADLYKFYNIVTGRDLWPDWMLDATKPWNCPDNFWGGIYCSHVIEHVNYIDAISMLREAYRTLQPGKWIRVIVPDLGKYISYYQGELVEKDFKQYKYGALAISDLTQNWGHISVWDEYLLIDVLQELGYINVSKVEFQVGHDSELLKDDLTSDRQWESLYVEAQKP